MPPQLNKNSLDPENSKMMHRIKQYVDQYRDMLCIELDSKLYYTANISVVKITLFDFVRVSTVISL